MEVGIGALPNRLRDLGSVVSSPQRGPGQSPGRQRILGIFEVTEHFLKREQSQQSRFSVKKIHSIGPPVPFLNTPLAFGVSMIQRMSNAEQNCQTQSAPKHRKKSSDLRRRLKTVSDVDEVTLNGRPVASAAMGHWGTSPLDFQQFHF